MSYWHLFVVITVIYLGVKLVTRRRSQNLPPGPPGYPFIGNIFDIPSREMWLYYQEISRRYDSDIIHFNKAGTPVIVVNSYEAANDLFNKRSGIYSDRPRMPMLNELIGFSWHFAFMPYGKNWQVRRKLFHQEFQPPASLKYRPSLLKANYKFLLALLETPENFMEHARHMAGRIILSAAYGVDVKDENDPHVLVAEKGMQGMAAAGNGTDFLVDQLPFLKYLPSWFPGAEFKRKAAEWHKSVGAMPIVPMEIFQRSLADGTAMESVALRVIKSMQADGTDSPENIRILADMLSSMYAAGSDTTVSSVNTFMLAMVQNPEIQKKGQTAVDQIVKNGRLPDFSDYQSIPYVDAILKEVLRWKPVTPLAVPHATSADDNYKGFDIPNGSIVIGNAWSMCYDETMYGPDTHLFNPDRFLKDGELNPLVKHPDMPFGYGRRICPGQDMAETSVWITIATVLACFDITKAVDETGAVIEPSGEYTSGMLIHPCPFQCTIIPRGPHVEGLIRQALQEQYF